MSQCCFIEANDLCLFCLYSHLSVPFRTLFLSVDGSDESVDVSNLIALVCFFSDCSFHLFPYDVRILHFYWNGSWTHSPPTAPSHFSSFFAVCIDRTNTHNAGLFFSPIVSCPRPSLLGHLPSFLPPMLPHAACPLAFPKVIPNNLLRLCVLFPHAGPPPPHIASTQCVTYHQSLVWVLSVVDPR